MREPFINHFKEACNDSYSSDLSLKKQEDPAYTMLQERHHQLMNRIREALAEAPELLDEWEDNFYRLRGIEEEWIYRAGMEDSVHLLRHIGAL